MTEKEYYKLIRPYADAMNILVGRLNMLKHGLYQENEGSPIHNIQYRIKKKLSLENKLALRGFENSVESAKENLQDIAGIRVICYFVDDIYNLINALKRNTDCIQIRETDYIKDPKPNGYRSYHVILGVPVYYIDGMEYYPVEVQFRTIAMDLWASMEHQILYKHSNENQEAIAEELKGYAEHLLSIEKSMERYSRARVY